MIDIMCHDGYLFSGRYREYFLEDSSLAGISLSNAIRYFEFKKTDGTRGNREFYIVPNQGEFFLPVTSIRDFHIWKITNESEFTLPLRSRENATYIAWCLGIQWALKHLPKPVKFNVWMKDPAPSPQEIEKFTSEDRAKFIQTYEKLFSELTKLRLNLNDVVLGHKEKNQNNPTVSSDQQ